MEWVMVAIIIVGTVILTTGGVGFMLRAFRGGRNNKTSA